MTKIIYVDTCKCTHSQVIRPSLCNPVCCICNKQVVHFSENELKLRVDDLIKCPPDINQPVQVYIDGFKDGANFAIRNLQQAIPHDLELLQKIWHKRNPCHEANANSGEDMFWGTLACVIDDYVRSKNKGYVKH